MTRFSALLVLFVALCLPRAYGTDANKLFADLRQKVLLVKDYTAEVKMKINVSYMKIPPLHGKMYYKSPDKMRLERNGGLSILPKKNINMTLSNLLPTGDVMVIDGGTTTIDGRTVRVIKVVPDEEKSEIILAKIWIDEVRMVALRTQTTTRNDGTILMDLEYDKYISYSLPDKVTIHMDINAYKLPKGVTMDYNDLDAVKPAAPNKNQKGSIVINYQSYVVNKGVRDEVFTAKEY